MIYISIIQLFLILQFCLVVFCELTPFFADTFKSVSLRMVLGLCLVTLSYYANYLIFAPYHIILIIFALCAISTFLSFHFIIKEYVRRLQRANRLTLLTKTTLLCSNRTINRVIRHLK